MVRVRKAAPSTSLSTSGSSGNLVSQQNSAVIDGRGRLKLPNDAIKHLKVRSGDVVLITFTDFGLEVRPARLIERPLLDSPGLVE